MAEYLDIVDENNTVVAQMERGEANKRKRRFRAAKIVIYDSKKNLLLQKRRKEKPMYPSCWDLGVAETVQAGESIEEAAVRGLIEEMGIYPERNQVKFHFLLPFENMKIKRIFGVYSCLYDGRISPQAEEIEEIAWIGFDELQGFISSHDMVPSVHPIIKRFPEMFQ